MATMGLHRQDDDVTLMDVVDKAMNRARLGRQACVALLPGRLPDSLPELLARYIRLQLAQLGPTNHCDALCKSDVFILAVSARANDPSPCFRPRLRLSLEAPNF